MAIVGTVDVITNALWPQGDIRDPLGIWGARASVTGDATGGSIKVTIQAAALQAAAYLYTCYSLQATQLTGTQNAITCKARLLTNWPNIDIQAGVQGYSTFRHWTMNGSATFTAPKSGPIDNILSPLDRFLLLFDPRPSAGVLEMVEIELAENIDTDITAFEAYGYYWDRSVLNAPGGLRHPGSN